MANLNNRRYDVAKMLPIMGGANKKNKELFQSVGLLPKEDKAKAKAKSKPKKDAHTLRVEADIRARRAKRKAKEAQKRKR